MNTVRERTIDALRQMQAEGQHTLPVDDEARGILHSWMAAVKLQPPAEPVVDAMDAAQKLAYLRERAARWKPTAALGTLRSTMVFAVGNPCARIMLVGEAPGAEEERLGEPFVGPAGQLLTKILDAMGLSREDVYISNVCKWRPALPEPQGTANRPPSPEEIAASLPLILAEIRAIRPACILCLGGSSAKALLQTEMSVSSMRGRWAECQGVPVRVTYHPSYLLRNPALSARRAVWEDMLAVMERCGMPISEKQRRYFLK